VSLTSDAVIAFGAKTLTALGLASAVGTAYITAGGPLPATTNDLKTLEAIVLDGHREMIVLTRAYLRYEQQALSTAQETTKDQSTRTRLKLRSTEIEDALRSLDKKDETLKRRVETIRR
jgi:TfoX/Sxy family transcriptional regulator of competence genes